jgi:hypothetical protein
MQKLDALNDYNIFIVVSYYRLDIVIILRVNVIVPL